MNDADYRIDGRLRSAIFAEAIEPRLARLAPENHPKTVWIGAQPGAGKTRARTMIIDILGGSYVRVDPDDLRAVHPYYDDIRRTRPEDMPRLTAPFANGMMDRLVKRCEQRGLSCTMEGTWHPSDEVGKRIRRNAGKGRISIAVAVAVPTAVSMASALHRCLVGTDKRWATFDYLQTTARNIVDDVRSVAGCDALDVFMVTNRRHLLADGAIAPSDAYGIWFEEFHRTPTSDELAYVTETSESAKTLIAPDSPIHDDARRLTGFLDEIVARYSWHRPVAPAVIANVHPGAFCDAGAMGRTSKGTLMRCAPGSDGRNRWRRA